MYHKGGELGLYYSISRFHTRLKIHFDVSTIDVLCFITVIVSFRIGQRPIESPYLGKPLLSVKTVSLRTRFDQKTEKKFLIYVSITQVQLDISFRYSSCLRHLYVLR